jgi:hypothetical protein
MPVSETYRADIDAILARRYDQGADLWTTPDRRLCKGSPFSALESAHLLLELGVDPTDPLLADVARLFWDAWREDGRFRLSPQGAIYPCHSLNATHLLCRLGYAHDPRLHTTFDHVLRIQHDDGGWRCAKFSYGRGPETEFSNPGPTLTALNAFRFTEMAGTVPALDRAVDFLLGHWATRAPLGPCHFGIGTLFMQVEYPFASYNLFVYVYVLSYYARARQDERFHDALVTLQSRLRGGQVVVERVNRRLAGLTFCRKGQPSQLATHRYQEIVRNLR